MSYPKTLQAQHNFRYDHVENVQHDVVPMELTSTIELIKMLIYDKSLAPDLKIL